MAYAAKADLETRYGAAEILQLADRDANGVADTGVIEAALADAGNEIDGYLAGRYPLPLTETPAMITNLACVIARYRLWSDDASDRVRQDYEDARATLAQIAKGVVQLVFTTPATGEDDLTTGGIALVQSTRVFTDTFTAGALL